MINDKWEEKCLKNKKKWRQGNCGDASSRNRQTRTVPTKCTQHNKYFDLKKKKTRQKYIIIVGYIIFSLFTYSLLTLSLSLHLLTIQFLSVVSFSFLFVLFCFIFASLTLLTFLTLSLSLVLSFFLFNFERERERGGEFLSWVGLSRSAQLKCDGKQWILQPFFLLQSLLQPHS